MSQAKQCGAICDVLNLIVKWLESKLKPIKKTSEFSVANGARPLPQNCMWPGITQMNFKVETCSKPSLLFWDLVGILKDLGYVKCHRIYIWKGAGVQRTWLFLVSFRIAHNIPVEGMGGSRRIRHQRQRSTQYTRPPLPAEWSLNQIFFMRIKISEPRSSACSSTWKEC